MRYRTDSSPSGLVGGRLLLLLGLLLLVACSREEPPLRIGFVGGLSDRTADIGVAGRDGALLAVEQVNAAGGIGGRKIELLVRDIGRDEELAKQAVRELAREQVVAIVGPMMSEMAVAMAPVAEAEGTLLIAPTVSTGRLDRRDDAFLRIYPSCMITSETLATTVYQIAGLRRMALIIDLRNRAFSEAWRDCFNRRFASLGGIVVATVEFRSGEPTHFQELVGRALARQPDGLLLLASAVDTAMLSQQVRKQSPGLPLFCSEWSFTPQLLALGGRSVEGMTLFHTFNEQSRKPAYLAFVDAYTARFGAPPSFPAIHAYDATELVLRGLAQGGRTPAELKRALLQMGPVETLQSRLQLDRYGDVEREFYLTRVIDGRFVVIGIKEPGKAAARLLETTPGR